MNIFYRCCEHCKGDVIHDVEQDGHDLACDVCKLGEAGRERAPLKANK